MKLVVTDTNVFIDMMDVGVLVALFGLGLEMHTTAFVVNELASDQQAQLWPYISTGRLKVVHFDPAEIKPHYMKAGHNAAAVQRSAAAE